MHQHTTCTARPPQESDRTRRTRLCKSRTLTYLVHGSDTYMCHNPHHPVHSHSHSHSLPRPVWCPDNDSSRCRGEVTGPTHGPRAGRVRADCETAPCPLPARALPALDEICPRSARALSWALTCALARAFGHLPADSLLLRISPPPGSAAPLVRSPLSALSSSRASSLVTQPRSRTLI